MIWQSGKIEYLSHGPDAIANDINDAGDAVGTDNHQAVLWKQGQEIVLPTPKEYQSAEGCAINNRLQ